MKKGRGESYCGILCGGPATIWKGPYVEKYYRIWCRHLHTGNKLMKVEGPVIGGDGEEVVMEDIPLSEIFFRGFTWVSPVPEWAADPESKKSKKARSDWAKAGKGIGWILVSEGTAVFCRIVSERIGVDEVEKIKASPDYMEGGYLCE